MFTTTCEIDITYYPFDQQTCSMNFANWAYRYNQVSLNSTVDKVDTLPYSPNGEWDLTHTETIVSNMVVAPNEMFNGVQFVFHFQRKPLYYVMNVILPAAVMSVLVLLVYWLPPDSGEKVSMAVTLLLSYTVFLLMISENVPRISTSVPLISKFIEAICYGVISTRTSYISFFTVFLKYANRHSV